MPVLRPVATRRTGVDLAAEPCHTQERVQQLLSSSVSGFADACLWMMRDGVPFPVLAYTRAVEIHAPLLEWAENDPTAWFTLHIGELPDDPPGYLIVLQPRIERSVERFKLGFPPNLLEGIAVEVIFSPLYFLATGTSYRDLKDRLGASSMLGLLDARDFRADRAEEFDPQRILPLGPFEVRDMAELGCAQAFLQRAGKLPHGQ
jgi:hypothetical protein